MKHIVYILMLLPTLIFSQESIDGVIVELTEQKKTVPLPGANVYWLDSTIGSTTDIDGKFSIPYDKEYTKLVISYVGYKTDTISVNSAKILALRLPLPKDTRNADFSHGVYRACRRGVTKVPKRLW